MGTIMERRNLKEARRRRNWSQDRLAELMKTRRETISDWERGIKSPDFYNREQLARLFGCTSPEELETLLMLVPDPKEETSSSALLLPDFVRRNLSASLLCIVHTSYRAPSEMTTAIQAVIEDFDMMNIGDAAYQLTRREALCSLAALPITTLGQKPTLHTKHYSEMLMHCNAALEACWQLYRGSDPTGTQYAFECCCTYVPLLRAITKDSAQYRKEALDLATRYALLQTLLGEGRALPRETVGYAQNALDLSNETSDILLQLSAYTKLGTACFRDRQYKRAYKTILKGESVLRDYQRMKKTSPLPSGIIGSFNSGSALIQTRNGISPDTALGIATDSEPLREPVAFVEFTASTQWLEAAKTCCSKNDPTQAMIWIGKRIDPETLVAHPDVPQSKHGRIEAVNTMTHALLQSKKPDMERVIPVWTAGMEGAYTLKNEETYRQAIVNFEWMQALYPGEQRIMKLIPLTSHW